MKLQSCPSCKKPLPRCSVCLVNMGTASGSNVLAGSESDRLSKAMFDDRSKKIEKTGRCLNLGSGSLGVRAVDMVGNSLMAALLIRFCTCPHIFYTRWSCFTPSSLVYTPFRLPCHRLQLQVCHFFEAKKCWASGKSGFPSGAVWNFLFCSKK